MRREQEAITAINNQPYVSRRIPQSLGRVPTADIIAYWVADVGRLPKTATRWKIGGPTKSTQGPEGK